MNPLWWYGIGYVVGVFVTAFIFGMKGRDFDDEESVWCMMFWPIALAGWMLILIHKAGRKTSDKS